MHAHRRHGAQIVRDDEDQQKILVAAVVIRSCNSQFDSDCDSSSKSALSLKQEIFDRNTGVVFFPAE
jgi:hypothetical protein